MLRVGQRCEDIQKKERSEAALAKYEDQHDVRILRDAQDLVNEGAIEGGAEKIAEFVETETHLKKRSRVVNLARFKPKGKTREEICQQVATEIGQISWHTVNKYWKEYRANLR